MKISTGQPMAHSTNDEVAYVIASGQPLTDGDAAAIASWYQSPRGHGLTFAMLAQGSPVEADDLAAAIHAELTSDEHSKGPDLFELQALRSWAHSKMSPISTDADA